MEYLVDINDSLGKINEDGICWINILNNPEYIRGSLRIASDAVDFVKYPVEARHEMEKYEKNAIGEMKNLYRNTSGCRIVAFNTSKRVIIKAKMKRKWGYRKMNLWNSHGFDIYEIKEGLYRHKTVVAPGEGHEIFAEQIELHKGEVCIYLPAYNCIEELFIGIEKKSKFDPIHEELRLPVVFYGNSVTEGSAASRSGNIFPNIIQRKLRRDIINLSASSCCRALDSMVEVIGRINVHAIVLDYTRNASSIKAFQATHDAFYRSIRKYHPYEPIILMTSCNFNESRQYLEFDKIVMGTYKSAINRGENVYMVYVMGLFDKSEYGYVAIDGSHMIDLGMYRVADTLVNILK